MERGKLQSVFVGLGTGIDEEELIVVITTGFSKALGELLLQMVDNGIGIESKRVQLLGEFLDIMRMAMTDADDGMAAVKVKIFLAFAVPNVAAFALDDVDVEERIYGV